MLVLSRRAGESIIAGDTTIKVLRIVGGRVRIGIEADESTRIRRSELTYDVKAYLDESADRQRFGDDDE